MPRSCKMTKMHFQLIADLLREQYDGAALANSTEGMVAITNVAVAFSRRLGQTNPAFDRDRFLAACQVNKE